VQRVRVVHWKDSEVAPVLETCRAGGFQVEYDPADLPAIAKIIRKTLPDAVVIDLSRMPSAGRELAFAIRARKYTRGIALVFADGEPEKVEAIRRQLPDATFTSRRKLCSGIAAACRKHVLHPVAPPTVMERYGSRTKAQKLGIKEGTAVGLIDAPRDYAAVLGEMPPDVEFLEDPDTVQPVTLWFVRDPRDYRAGLRRMRTIAPQTKLWVIWRKGSPNGLNGNVVREFANEAGLVDYKICAVGEQWSGMVFAVRKT
jgi:CheY-like chemotaxis protein